MVDETSKKIEMSKEKKDDGLVYIQNHSTKVWLVVLAMTQITLAAGLIVGWPGIAGSLLVAPTSEGGAALTLDQTTQLYSMAAAVNYVAPLFLGYVLDKLGPRWCSVLSNSIVAVGLVGLSWATSYNTFAAALALVAFGGPSCQQSLLHVGNLFAKRRFFVMGMVAESITLSFAVFPLMDILWTSAGGELSFRTLFGGLGALVAVSAFLSFLFWPNQPYPVLPVPKDDDADSETEVLLGSEDKKVQEPEEEDPNDLKNLNFWGQFTSGVYLRVVIFFIVTSWWANFYIATVTTELGDQQIFSASEQHNLTRWLSFLDAGAIVAAPLSGFMLDSVGFAATATCTLLVGALQQVLLLVAGSSSMVMVISFAVYALFRSFLFPYFFATLSRQMGFANFGMLTGLGFCISGLTQFTVAPVALWVQGDCHHLVHHADMVDSTLACDGGRWTLIHIVQMAQLLAMLILPYMDWRREEMQAREKKQKALPKDAESSYGALEKPVTY